MAEHFDAILVGRSLAALLCAGLLAKRKIRVRVVEPDGPLPAPWPTPVVGLKASPIVRRVLEELGLVHALRTRTDGEPRGVHVALPDRRFTLEPELGPRGIELGRAFPEHHTALLALFDRIEGYGGRLDTLLSGDVPLPPEGFSQRRQLRRALAELPASQLEQAAPPVPEPLQGLLAALYAVMGRPDDPAEGLTAGGARALFLLCHGTTPLRQGPEALRTLVEEKLLTYGGQLETRRRAATLEVQGRRVKAVLMGDGHRVTTDAVIFGEDDETLARMCPEAGAAPDPPAVAMRWKLPPELLPADFEDPLGWQVAGGTRGVNVRREADAVAAVALADETPPLTALFPLLAVPAGAPGPVARPVMTDGEPLALWRRPVARPLANLVRVGPSELPGLGLETDALTAWHAARRVGERLQRSVFWPFGRS